MYKHNNIREKDLRRNIDLIISNYYTLETTSDSIQPQQQQQQHKEGTRKREESKLD